MQAERFSEIAEEMRRRAGQDEPAFSTRAIVDACFPDAIVTGRELPVGVQDMVTLTERGPLIVYRRGIAAADQRFAIAHAVAHLMFDLVDGARPAFDNAEVEARADDFALELLAPLAELEPYVGRFPDEGTEVERELYLDQVDEIASHFNVPAWVIDKQIRRLPR